MDWESFDRMFNIDMILKVWGEVENNKETFLAKINKDQWMYETEML